MPEAAVREAWAAFADPATDRLGMSRIATQWRLYSFEKPA